MVYGTAEVWFRDGRGQTFTLNNSTNQKARGFVPLLGSALLVGPFNILVAL